LDDIRETIIDDQRVLAVKSGLRKEFREEPWEFPKPVLSPIFSRTVL
jgi:hypothetical protein